MTMEAERIDQPTKDPVSNVLKWILLVVAVASFAILGWTTKLTYEAAPPFPDRFVTSDWRRADDGRRHVRLARQAFRRPT